MRNHDLSNARNPDLRASLGALQRAAEIARQKAMDTNTAIVVVRNGKLMRIPADKLRDERRDQPGKAS